MLYFVLALVLFIALDYVWFKITKSVYIKTIQEVQKEPVKINYFTSFLLYFLLVVFLYIFVIENFKDGTSYANAITYGFLVGGTLYLFVNLVTASTFTQYSTGLLVMDSIWGGVSFAIVSVVMLALGVHNTE